jgi:uncharacterized FlaG/YvyC family protein
MSESTWALTNNDVLAGNINSIPAYPNERNIQKYLEDLDYFVAIIEENIDFKIKDVLNRRQIKRKHGITHETEQEKAALALYKVACKLAKDWEAFWIRRD